MENNNSELKELKSSLSEIEEKMRILRNEESSLNQRKTELAMIECKKDIGRCFKKFKDGELVSYCKIIDIDKPVLLRHGESFNEYQYPALWFKYPYDNSLSPFYVEDIFAGAWGKTSRLMDIMRKVSYEEISKEEFIEKFKEINNLWMENISE